LNKAPEGKSGSSMGKFIKKIDEDIYKSDDARKEMMRKGKETDQEPDDDVSLVE
jgi:hypothetical protein